MIVRCDHWETCGATDYYPANNYCEHWPEHLAGSTEDDCPAVCHGHRGREHLKTDVCCEAVTPSGDFSDVVHAVTEGKKWKIKPVGDGFEICDETGKRVGRYADSGVVVCHLAFNLIENRELRAKVERLEKLADEAIGGPVSEFDLLLGSERQARQETNNLKVKLAELANRKPIGWLVEQSPYNPDFCTRFFAEETEADSEHQEVLADYQEDWPFKPEPPWPLIARPDSDVSMPNGWVRSDRVRTVLAILADEECSCHSGLGECRCPEFQDQPLRREAEDCPKCGNEDEPENHHSCCPVYLAAHVREVLKGKDRPNPDSGGGESCRA